MLGLCISYPAVNSQQVRPESSRSPIKHKAGDENKTVVWESLFFFKGNGNILSQVKGHSELDGMLKTSVNVLANT